MKAVVITRPGAEEVLAVRDVAEPRAAAGEVVVAVRASAVNRADLLQRLGRYPAPPGAPADIPGLEYAGEVAEVGEGVTGWSAGDRVFGIVGGGAHAERVVVPAETLVRIPESLSWTGAGAMPEAFVTAHDALVTQAGMRTGEGVLITAVGSGVGIAAVQLAAAMGAAPFGMTRTASKLTRARDYGLRDGLVGGDADALRTEVTRWTAGRGMDIALDLVGGAGVAALASVLAVQGRLMLVGLVAGREATLDLGMLLGRRLTVRGTVLRSRTTAEKGAAMRAFARDVLPLVESGRVRPVVDVVLPFAEIREAHRRVAADENFGKVVLTW